MAREGDKWRVVRGDCLWNIAKASYGNPYKWTEIADANGVSRRTALIYPGQLLTLPGITAGSTGGGSATPPPSPPAARKVTIQWWALDAGTTRDMFCTWTYNRADTAGYNIEVWYDTGVGGWRNQVKDTTTTLQQYAVSVNANAKKVKLKIKPYSTKINSGGNEVYKWTDGEWVEVEYDFRNNPPLRPSTPTVELKNNKLTCSLSNIDEDINGTQIEFAVYKNNTIKYQTGIANINLETRFVSFVFDVEDGGIYTVRCRAIRNGNIYSNWSDYTNEVRTAPIAPEKITDLRPEVISEQGSKQYGMYIEWTPVTSAKNYIIEYTTNPAYFDISGQVESITTNENQGNKYLITNIEIGHTYYFRVCASNDSGQSDWTPIATTSLGSRPSAPTTWSNVQNSTIGQDLKLYWVHNSTDGSLERIARLHITAVDLAHPELAPTEFDEVIRNTKPEEDKDKTSVYVINTTDTKWSFLKEGFVLKWKVQTAGVAEEYSEYSVEREINVYMPPEITIDVTNQNGQSMDDISSFPFYIKVNSKPASQTPISYYLEIVANSKYDTVDPTGKKTVVNAGDRIYQRYYDPTENPWSFLAEMTPGNIDLKSGISYTVNCTVAMNSSLTASNKQVFNVVWTDSYYNVGANIILNKETLEASIHPYCNEYYIDAESGNTLEKLAEDCTLSVYRREYNGTYTLIGSGINNSDNTYIIDPHPALDYARYRVTATSNKTGSISYADIEPVYFGIPSFVVQWNEEWVDFDSETSDNEESKYSNSMIQIPYNVDISETANVDVTLIEYIGREHPVSYYGTHLGESFTANVEIPKSDTNLIYQLRRLAKYAGDVYVREPSGIGYWANISVQFSMKHKTVTIPVSFTMKRVEGGYLIMADWTKSMTQTFEYYEVDPISWKDKKRLTEVTGSSITRDLGVDTLGSATIDVVNMVGETYIRIYLVTNQNGITEKHPLGTYLVQTPQSSFDGKNNNVSMDAYTPLIELKENNVPLGYTILKGENILDNAYQITKDNCRCPVVKPTSDKILNSDFVANTDDKYMTFIRDLLNQGKFQFDLDEMGRILFRPVQKTETLQPVCTFNDDNSSILYPEMTLKHDLYGIPNIVEVYARYNGELFHSIAKNDDPASPTSIVNRGRKIVYRITDPGLPGIPTQEQIDDYAKDVLSEASSLEYTITFTHGYYPCRPGDCVRLNYKRAGLQDIKAKIISQNITCDSGVKVKTTAVFTKKLWS